MKGNANTILLLDDELDVVTPLSQLLKKCGFHIFAFTNPLLALEHFRLNSKNYGLVISDLRMPGMNGYEFIKKVKEIKPEVKVFFMTAFKINDLEFRKVLPSVIIDEFIQKPVSGNDLATVIERYIWIKTKTIYDIR